MEEINEQEIRERERELEDKAKRFYLAVLDYLRYLDFEPTMAEAAYLKHVALEVIRGNRRIKSENSMDYSFTFPEICHRFYNDYYGIDIINYPVAKEKEILELIKKKYRPEKETM